MNPGKDTKKCEACGTFLSFSSFYKNKSKVDGYQNRCIDCIKDYKDKIRKGIEPAPKIKRTSFFIPDIYLVGYGRTQIFQNCCLSCNDPFFCLKQERDAIDLFCESCDNKKIIVPERCISNVNYIGTVIGWLAKTESPEKKRTQRNYKKVYERDRYTCQYCGYNLKDSPVFMPLHIDHIKPWSAQGGNSMNNMVVACRDCNLLASDKWFTNLEEKKEFITFEKQKRLWIQKKNL